MKKSAGLIVMVMLPDADGKKILTAVLQRRGCFNTEKMKPESYPGCCQVTAHGKLEEGEDFHQAAIRESFEELGEEFTEMNAEDVDLVELVHQNDGEKETVTYGILVPADRLKAIRLGPDSGGLVMLKAEQVRSIFPITDYMKLLRPNVLLAMFSDEIEAVQKAFEVFRNK